MFTFKILKSKDATEEAYQSALQCARDSVESVLNNKDLLIKAFGTTITISHFEPTQSIDMADQTCKERIKGCFCDADGKLYAEFSRIIQQ
ncbi:MAG: hypothetical protein JRG71_03935 [Deltaproteobacteria bacterium]|nr:hypothetical protein [Deltaproteobacteria bacterium]